MIRLTRTQLLPMGLDIGRDSVKLLELELIRPATLRARGMARLGIPGPCQGDPRKRVDAAAALVREALRTGEFAGRRCVAALPRELVQVKNFRMPMMPQEEMAAAVRFEARTLFGAENDDCIVGFVPAGEVRQGSDTLQEVIVLCAREGDVAEFLERLACTGLVVDSLDAAPCALFRSIERFIRRREDEQEVHVLLDVGLGATGVVIGKGRDISFIKSIEIGGSHFHEAVATRLGLPLEEAAALRRQLMDAAQAPDPEKKDPVRQAVFDATRSVMEQLAREVSLCLRYQSVTFRGHRPARLRLLGGEAGDPHLQAILSSVLTIPVEPARPLYSVDLSGIKAAERRGAMPEWALALGLALRRTTGRFAPRDGKPRSASIMAPAPPVEVEVAHA